MHDAAVKLALDDHRVADVADVADGDEALDFDFAAVFVDFDDGDLRAAGIVEVGRVEEGGRFETGFHAFGQIPGIPERQRDFEQGDAFVQVVAVEEAAVVEVDVVADRL